MEDRPAGRFGRTATGSAGDVVTEQVRQQTEEIVYQTQQAAGQVATQAKDRAKSVVETQKDRAAESLHGVADAFRQTGESLESSNQAAVGRFATQAANQVEKISGYLQQRDSDQLVWELENFTRRNPALVIGGAFALGILAARFLKSSSPPTSPQGYTPYSQGSGPEYRNYAGPDISGAYRYQRTPHSYEPIQRSHREYHYSPENFAEEETFPTGRSGEVGSLDSELPIGGKGVGAAATQYPTNSRDLRSGDGA